jgi:hypothetical protein
MLSARPTFTSKDKPRCTPCPAPCAICKTVDDCTCAMDQHYSTKHAGIDLPAHFMIGPLERSVVMQQQFQLKWGWVDALTPRTFPCFFPARFAQDLAKRLIL